VGLKLWKMIRVRVGVRAYGRIKVENKVWINIRVRVGG
jgi:hypothetical protein